MNRFLQLLAAVLCGRGAAGHRRAPLTGARPDGATAGEHEGPRGRRRLGVGTGFYAFVPPLEHVESHHIAVTRSKSLCGAGVSRWVFHRLD